MEGVKSLNRLSCFLHVIVETNRIYEGSRMFLEIGRRRKRKRERKRDRNRVINRVIVSLIFFFLFPLRPIDLYRSILHLDDGTMISLVPLCRRYASCARVHMSSFEVDSFSSHVLQGGRFKVSRNWIQYQFALELEEGGRGDRGKRTYYETTVPHSRFSGGCFDETEVRSRRGYKTASVRE